MVILVSQPRVQAWVGDTLYYSIWSSISSLPWHLFEAASGWSVDVTIAKRRFTSFHMMWHIAWHFGTFDLLSWLQPVLQIYFRSDINNCWHAFLIKADFQTFYAFPRTFVTTLRCWRLWSYNLMALYKSVYYYYYFWSHQQDQKKLCYRNMMQCVSQNLANCCISV